MGFIGECGSVGLTVGFDCVKGLFQPKEFVIMKTEQMTLGAASTAFISRQGGLPKGHLKENGLEQVRGWSYSLGKQDALHRMLPAVV